MRKLNLILIASFPVGLINIVLQTIMYFSYGSISPDYWSETAKTIMLYFGFLAPAFVITIHHFLELELSKIK